MKICKVETKREEVDTEYKVCGNYCCGRMKKWLSIERYGRKNLKYNPHTERFNICVREAEEYYGGFGGRDTSEHEAAYEDLDFCPFCGERLQGTQAMAAEERPTPKKRGRKK